MIACGEVMIGFAQVWLALPSYDVPAAQLFLTAGNAFLKNLPKRAAFLRRFFAFSQNLHSVHKYRPKRRGKRFTFSSSLCYNTMYTYI